MRCGKGQSERYVNMYLWWKRNKNYTSGAYVIDRMGISIIVGGINAVGGVMFETGLAGTHCSEPWEGLNGVVVCRVTAAAHMGMLLVHMSGRGQGVYLS